MGLNLAYMVQNQLVFWPNYKKKKKKIIKLDSNNNYHGPYSIY